MASLFYGWRVVAVCLVAAVFAWGFGSFGMSVYLAALTREHGLSVAFVSSAVTVYYLTNALAAPAIGSAIDRYGARPVFVFGAVMLGGGVAAMGGIDAPWQLYFPFVLIGLGYGSLAVTGITAAIAPWFERHQGRSVAIALTGASLGAVLVIPLLVAAIRHLGFATALSAGGCLTIAVMVPLALVVLRRRSPLELGLGPDGDPIPAVADNAAGTTSSKLGWTRREAMRTASLWTVAAGFSFGLIVQVGFLTHHVKLAEPFIGITGAAWLVSATGLSAFFGRLVLARVADTVELRRYTGAILGVQALVLALIALMPGPATLIGASLVYGFCQGQITTLSPIIVRREFGAASYGAIYGVAATLIQFSSAFGPSLFGSLRDLFGGYGGVLAVAAAFELAAMATILFGRPPVAAAALAGRR